MTKPIAVLISDVHYNINTLELASKAMKMALAKAEELGVPFIVAGDLHDTKAHMRAECVNALRALYSNAQVPCYILVGNHDLINEKGTENALEFLRELCVIVRAPLVAHAIGSYLLPYYSDSEKLQKVLDGIPKGSRLIMHQGVQSAFMGHYTQDKTSLPPESFKDFRVISGHYHRAQDIKCGPPRKGAVGLFSYIGNPYSLTFGEASDGPKGFQILYDNGLLEQVPTNLRKHIILEYRAGAYLHPVPGLKENDLLWVKITGSESELQKIDKDQIGSYLIGHSNYKLDLIPTDSDKLETTAEDFSGEELMDQLIDALPDSDDHKATLKGTWRDLL